MAALFVMLRALSRHFFFFFSYRRAKPRETALALIYVGQRLAALLWLASSALFYGDAAKFPGKFNEKRMGP